MYICFCLHSVYAANAFFFFFFGPPLHVMEKILCFLPENSSARRPACCSYDLSHMSWLRGNRVILFLQLSHSNNMINTVFSGWLKSVNPRKGRRPLWALSKQGLFNHCSREICSQDLIESAPEARLAQPPSAPHFEGCEMPITSPTAAWLGSPGLF